MTVKEAILWVDSQKSNAVPEQVTALWLGEYPSGSGKIRFSVP